MAPSVVVDTGPLVALLDADEANHGWVVGRMQALRPPLLTCEAVLTETAFVLARLGGDPAAVVDLAARGMLRIVEPMSKDAEAVARLMRRYASARMSFADACLVRLVERTPNATLMTLDSGFRIYRQRGRRLIPLLAP